MSNRLTIGVVTVPFGHEKVIGGLLDELGAQKRVGDKVAVVDNHPGHLSADVAENHDAADIVIRSANNGFADGNNQGAAALGDSVDLLFFLNPDTHLTPGVLDKLRAAANGEYDAWMPLLVLPDGRVNSAGNVVHISGLSWCDGYGEAASNFTKHKAIQALSGACLVITRQTFENMQGMTAEYFLYHEDTDFSARLVLAGYKLGLIPEAHIIHDYDFGKSNTKWLYMERNIPLYVLRTWPTAVILVMTPQLIAAAIGLWAISILEHRFWLKVRSLGMTLVALPWAFRTRSQVQRSRKITSYQFLETLTPIFNTPLLPDVITNSNLINGLLRTYCKVCEILLKAGSVHVKVRSSGRKT